MAHIKKDILGTPLLDLGFNVSAGEVSGASQFGSLGERIALGSTATGEDLWDGAATTIPVPPNAGEQMTVVSDDADDTAAGDGVRTIHIDYLDGNGIEQVEEITLNGTTPVDTVATDISFVNDMHALTVGATGVAEGTIIVYKKGAASTIYNQITDGGNQSLVSNRKIPTGKTYYVTGWTCCESKNKETTIRLRANCSDGGDVLVGNNDSFLFKRVAILKNNSFAEIINPPIKVCGGALIKVTGWASGGAGNANASFNGILVTD